MSQSGICQNERNWFQNCVRCSICLFQHTLKYMYLEIILSRPTDQSKVTIKYECKNNRKFIYLTFIHCSCKFEKYKQYFLSENYEQASPNKKHKQYNAHEKHKQIFPSEKYNRTRHAHARATSADIIPPCSLQHLCSLYHPDFIDKNCSLLHSFIVASFVVAYPTLYCGLNTCKL